MILCNYFNFQEGQGHSLSGMQVQIFFTTLIDP